MRLRPLVLAGALLVTGCATAEAPSRRGDALREVLGPSVQLRTERAGARRAGSGVVVASDTASSRSWVITTRHLFEPVAPQQIWVTTTDGGRRLRAVVHTMSPETDLAIVEVEGRALPAAVLRDTARLGDEVRVVSFPGPPS